MIIQLLDRFMQKKLFKLGSLINDNDKNICTNLPETDLQRIIKVSMFFTSVHFDFFFLDANLHLLSR